MKNNFNLKKFLIENKLTNNSKLTEQFTNENIEVLSDDDYNYTLVSAHDKDGNTQVIVHRQALYGEPDLKKTFKISLDKFINILQSKGGVEKDSDLDGIYFDANADALEKFLGSLGFTL
tara:strand:+ start:59 stop:415 length:357 start_codon:yes stop_codon:yes gene_type:complete